MAQITKLGPVRHLRSDASAHVLLFKHGTLRREGRGLSFLFQAHSASVAEVPADDRELPLLVHARSADWQDVTVQGVVTYRVKDPRTLCARVDFTLDLDTGALRRQPLEQLALLFAQRAEQHAGAFVARADLRRVLAAGPEALRGAVEAGLLADASLPAMGLEVVAVRVSAVRPTPDLEKALAAPTRESLQQAADEAAFARRALAVEKERAIQENELKNQIELARRQEELIQQQGQNARRTAQEKAEAERIAAEAAARRDQIASQAAAARARAEAEAEGHRVRTEGEASAHRTRAQGEADAAALGLAERVRTQAEAARMAAVRDVPPAVLMALAAQALAGKLEKIERVTLGGDALGPALEGLLEAGAKRLGRE